MAPFDTVQSRRLSLRLFLLLVVLAVVVVGIRASMQHAAWSRDLAQWRTARAQRLTAPEGWFSLTALDWISPGSSTFGSDPGNKIRLDSSAAPQLGTLTLTGATVSLTPPATGFPADFKVDGHPAASAPLVADDGGHPSKLTSGTLAMTVIHRGDRFALRVRDSHAPTRLGFHGLKWYPPSTHYRIVARWIPYNPPHAITMPDIIGDTLHDSAPGAAEFKLDGKIFRLEPILESPADTQLFFIFRDETSHSTTYGAGRFLYTGFPSDGLGRRGTIVLDFNRAQNPPCAYTPYATCPLPPPGNRLAVSIPAGEQRYHDETAP